MSGVVDFLMKLDLKKQINIVKLIDLPNFELTDEEDEVNPTTPQLLKVMKIIFYQIAMIEERQRWRNEDFVREYEEKDKKNENNFYSKFMEVESLHSQMKFDFEGMKEQIGSYKATLSSQYSEIKDQMQQIEQNIEDTRSFNY